MQRKILIKLVGIPFYAFIYNTSLANVLINLFHNDHFFIEELNTLLLLYIPILFFASVGKDGRLFENRTKVSNKKNLFLGIIFFICLSVCHTFIQIAYGLTQFEMSDFVRHLPSFTNVLLSLPSSIIIAPIIEEIVFRKLLYSDVKNSFPKFYILILTISFMLAHFIQIVDSPITAPFYFLISLALNLFYRKDENLFYTIIFHSMTNLIVTFTIYYAIFLQSTIHMPLIFGSIIILILLSIILLK
ncbi:CAAX amino terminal protease self- immunity [Enterococcus durans]|uniref:CAAX amino terminal protease self- immunity n=1 Tax=Enterococcus durans TaxID=53345 RepID=A0A377KHT1_9ENTE|nr:CPBP family glutamic-type intramembrane protease [Enterococcus durans]STP28719.1 CAAX amino terminal protease self- immunity [Enterococcus durans]